MIQEVRDYLASKQAWDLLERFDKFVEKKDAELIYKDLELERLKQQAKEETNETWSANFGKWCEENKGNSDAMKDAALYSIWLERNYQNPKRK